MSCRCDSEDVAVWSRGHSQVLVIGAIAVTFTSSARRLAIEIAAMTIARAHVGLHPIMPSPVLSVRPPESNVTPLPTSAMWAVPRRDSVYVAYTSDTLRQPRHASSPRDVPHESAVRSDLDADVLVIVERDWTVGPVLWRHGSGGESTRIGPVTPSRWLTGARLP